jgi:hypothetical protein
VRDRVGLIQILPPALPEVDAVFNTAPTAPTGKVLEESDEPDSDEDELPELEAIRQRSLAQGGARTPPALPEGRRARRRRPDSLPVASHPADDEIVADEVVDDEPDLVPDTPDETARRPVPVGAPGADDADAATGENGHEENGLGESDGSAADARRSARQRRRSPLAQALAGK